MNSGLPLRPVASLILPVQSFQTVPFHGSSGSTANPWLGAGVGYEWMSLNVQAVGQELAGMLRGFLEQRYMPPTERNL